MKKYKIKVGSDFSGVGAFNQALLRSGIDYDEIFACEIDKYSRQTFIYNYGEPNYYPLNVYDRIIPDQSLDIYMTSPPCQSFSLAGNRAGKDDERGILFFNSYEFILKNKPRYFIFENVSGLLSHDNGKTFSEWINLLGGKSSNGHIKIFNYPGALPYHIHYKIINAINHGVPQNRERIFIIGIRDDIDNNFNFPRDENLKIKATDLLEDLVDDKYFLSDKMIKYISTDRRGNRKLIIDKEIVSCITCSLRKGQRSTQDNYFMSNGRIRKITPLEAFRFMDFPYTFKFNVSDSQAYKQAGNSIVINVLSKIINNLIK